MTFKQSEGASRHFKSVVLPKGSAAWRYLSNHGQEVGAGRSKSTEAGQRIPPNIWPEHRCPRTQGGWPIAGFTTGHHVDAWLMLALMVMSCIDASAACRRVADLQGSSTLAARGWCWDEAGDSNATDDWWRTLCMPDSRLDVQAVGISSKWRESASAIHIDTR